MRKFILPIINLVNVILVGIAFILSGRVGALDGHNSKTFYELVWLNQNANVIGIVGFFLFVLAAAVTLAVFIPFPGRKYASAVGGAMHIAAGVLILLTPKAADVLWIETNFEKTGALIAMAVLVIIAGAFTLGMSVLEFLEKKESK